MHLNKITFNFNQYPTEDHYPFNLSIFRNEHSVFFKKPVTIFVGDNGSGKSTLLKAIARACSIHIWEGLKRSRVVNNPYENLLADYINIDWHNGSVPGSFFASELFHNFAENIDEWASMTPDILQYYGNKSLLVQSHGQCHMSYFKNRYNRRGIYFLDEPENALSPVKQLEMLNLLKSTTERGDVQFIIATHSPILMSYEDADIYSFDNDALKVIKYKETSHYKIYSDFFKN